MSDFNSLVQYTVENISRPIKYIIYKLTEFIRVVDKFVFRQVPSGAASGYATIEKIEGNTVQFNQLVSNGNFVDFTGWNINNASYTITDNVLTMVSTTSTGRLYRSMGFTSGHKYLLFLKKVSADGIFNFVIFNGDTRVYTSPNMSGTTTATYSFIYECVNTGTLQIQPVRVQASGVTVSVTNIQIHDLTAIFGAGNEPTTVADFEAWMAQNGLPSVADYNAGELLSVKMSGIQTEDSSQQTIDTLPFDVTTITGINTSTNVREVIFPNGMKQADYAGTVKDEIDLANGTATVNVGSVDMGTLTWTYNTTVVDNTPVFIAFIQPRRAGSIKFICTKYTNVNTGRSALEGTNLCIATYNTNNEKRICITDSQYSDATIFQNAVSGVYLVYELATPITYTDLQDANGNPLNPRYNVEQGGTEQVLPVNTSSPTTVAPTLTTTYTKDVH